MRDFDPRNVVLLDRLPPRAGLQTDIDGVSGKVRFRAYYLDPEPYYGLWTGDFSLEDCPINLCWDDLWPRGDPVNN